MVQSHNHPEQFFKPTDDLLSYSVIAILILCANSIINLFLNWFMAGLLPSESYGDFSLALRTVELVSLVALLGSNEVALKMLPVYWLKQQWENIRGYVYYSLVRLLAIGMFTLLIAVPIIIALILLNIVSMDTLELHHPIILIVILTILAGASLFFSSVLRSLGRIAASLWPFRVLYPLLGLIAIIILFYSTGYLNVRLALLMYGIAIVLVIILQIYLIFCCVPVGLFKGDHHYEQSSWQRLGLQILVSVLSYTGLVFIEFVMLKLLGKHKEDGGTFAVIVTLTGFIWMIYQAVSVSIRPKISVLITLNQTERLRTLVNQGTLLIAILSLAIGTGLFIYARPILTLFGSQYAYGTTALRITVVGVVLSATLGLGLLLLRYSGFQKTAAHITVTMLTASIVANGILIWFYDIVGATLAFALTSLCNELLNCYYAHKYLGIAPLNFKAS